jgi:hypothetical protein
VFKANRTALQWLWLPRLVATARIAPALERTVLETQCPTFVLPVVMRYPGKKRSSSFDAARRLCLNVADTSPEK